MANINITQPTEAISMISNTTARTNGMTTPTEPSETAFDVIFDSKTVTLIILLGLLIIVGTLGNGLVVYFFGLKRWNKWTIPDRLFLYLGIVDLLSSIINPSIFLYLEIVGYNKWVFGDIACKVIVSFGPITTLLSSLLIQIISIDRYFVIVKPFGRRYGSKCINLSVLAAVAVSILSYAYYFMALRVHRGTCNVPDVTEDSYRIPAVTFILLQDVTFITVIVFTNTSIVLKLSKKASLPDSETGADQQNKRRKKLFRMLLAMATIFLILILPKDLFQLAYTFSWMFPPGILFSKDLVQLNVVLKVLYVANSCANVFIYSKMHTHFQGALRKIFCRCTIPSQTAATEGSERKVNTYSVQRTTENVTLGSNSRSSQSDIDDSRL